MKKIFCFLFPLLRIQKPFQEAEGNHFGPLLTFPAPPHFQVSSSLSLPPGKEGREVKQKEENKVAKIQGGKLFALLPVSELAKFLHAPAPRGGKGLFCLQ